METLQATDADRLASLASALGVLPARMDVKIAGGAADLLDLTIRQTIATALDKPQVIDTKRINDLAGALAALAARMVERKNAATVAARCSQAVVEALDTPQITDSASLSGLGWVLGRLSPLIFGARQMQLVALSNILLDRIPESSEDWRSRA